MKRAKTRPDFVVHRAASHTDAVLVDEYIWISPDLSNTNMVVTGSSRLIQKRHHSLCVTN